jgi:putative ABC transport system substrate-binding protein
MIGYGVDIPALWYRAASFVDRILKGAKPVDLPVEQPTKFVLVVNVRVARTLGWSMPPMIVTNEQKSGGATRGKLTSIRRTQSQSQKK